LLKLEFFIPVDLAVAPAYKFGKPPNLVLREIPIDYNTSFQVWSPKADTLLLPEEASLLKRDRLRIAVICTKLIWLLGVNCSEYEDYFAANQKLFYDWDETVDFACRYKFKPNAIDVIFSPHTLRPLYNSLTNDPTHWVMEPPCWEIFFLQVKSCDEGFIAESRNPHLSAIVWTGKPVIKALAGNFRRSQISEF
jgi:hypothetical protein